MKKWLILLFIGSSALMASDGAILAKKCISCHGMNFEKAPLGRSHHIVKGDTKEELIKKIKYYQHPDEADEMVMKIQVQNLSDDDIESLAEYISTRK